MDHCSPFIPRNSWVHRDPDRRMPRVLVLLLLWACVMLVILSLIGWPRLRSTSTHYDLIRLRSQVTQLQQQYHLLEVAYEEERSPHQLALRAAELGLAPPSTIFGTANPESPL